MRDRITNFILVDALMFMRFNRTVTLLRNAMWETIFAFRSISLLAKPTEILQIDDLLLYHSMSSRAWSPTICKYKGAPFIRLNLFQLPKSFGVHVRGDGTQLFISSVQLRNAGTYRCLAKLLRGTETTTILPMNNFKVTVESTSRYSFIMNCITNLLFFDVGNISLPTFS